MASDPHAISSPSSKSFRVACAGRGGMLDCVVFRHSDTELWQSPASANTVRTPENRPKIFWPTPYALGSIKFPFTRPWYETNQLLGSIWSAKIWEILNSTRLVVYPDNSSETARKNFECWWRRTQHSLNTYVPIIQQCCILKKVILTKGQELWMK